MFWFIFVTSFVSCTFAGPLATYPLEQVIEKPKFEDDFSYSLMGDVLQSNMLKNILPLLPITVQQIQNSFKTMYNLIQLLSVKSGQVQQQFMPENGNIAISQNLRGIYEVLPNSVSVIKAASIVTNAGLFSIFF